MEQEDGRTLREVLDERKTLPWVVVALASYELCRGLAYAHEKGVVHRDLKPDNVMVSRTGSLKIGDFGIARALEATQLTATGVPVGTPAYLSPEQIRGEPADTRSDIFSLGVSLYELTTGKLPFDAETSTGIMYQIVEGKFVPPERLGLSDIDVELAEIINRCLSPRREHRPTAEQIVQMVGRMMQQRQVVDPRNALVQYFVNGIIPLTEVQPARRTRMPPAKWLGAGVALVALASLGAWGFLREVSPPRAAPPAPVATAPTPPAPEPAPPVAAAPPPVAPAPVAEPARMPETLLEPEQMNAGGPSHEKYPPPPAPKPGKRAPGAVTARPAPGDRTHGTLYLTVRGGWADVRVDGEVLGRTPTEREFQLKAGSHMLELSNPHRAPFRKVVHIPPGGTLKEEVELQEQP
jgi:serine/threonine-protein kinase